MNPHLSIWMDLLRVLSAAAVFIGHARSLDLTPASVGLEWHRSADDAVIVFFVISGYVIAWSTARAGGSLRSYVESRASRVYSVAIPAVLVALGMDMIGMGFDATRYVPDWQYPRLWLFLPLHWAFLGGTWVGPIDPFSMASYWSLPYEVWYYALFGCATLLTGAKRLGWTALIFALMGPRMWLLLPCWWLGVLLQQYGGKLAMPASAARVMMLITLLLYAAFVAGKGRAATDAASAQLYAWFSSSLPVPFKPGGTVHALTDYVVASLFTFFLVGCASARLAFGASMSRVIRALASYTFSLYLIHYSFLVLLAAAGLSATTWLQFAGVSCSTALVTWLLGQVGEMRRPWYRLGISGLLDSGGFLINQLRAARKARGR